MGKVLTVDTPQAFVPLDQPRPVWKRIGEASNDLVLSIERIDGYRIPVSRHCGMSDVMPRLGRAELDDIENQNRVQRDILREAYRAAMEVADTKAAYELRERYLQAEYELKREEVRIKQEASRIYPGGFPDRSPFSINPFW
jgi:hypothetical protein